MNLSVSNLLQTSPLLWDGAMGTLLQTKVDEVSCYDYLNITSPHIVTGIHKEYMQAGAQVIQTNSFALTGYSFAISTSRDAYAI